MTLHRILIALATAVTLPAVPLFATQTTAVAAPAALPQAVATTASPDFDGDGQADLAYSSTDAAKAWAKLVVTYGSGATTEVTAEEILDDAYGFVGDPVLAGDLNTDGYTDLVFHAYDDQDEVENPVDEVCLLFGSDAGLQLSSLYCFTPTIGGAFGFALIDAPTPRLAIGVLRSRVVVYDLDADGRPVGSPLVLKQGKGKVPALKGSSRKNPTASFGSTMASWGDQLFIGSYDARIGSAKQAGAVVALRFGRTGLKTARLISQSSRGVPGKAQASDWFGYALAARDGYLVVGAPKDNVGRVARTGSVNVFRITGRYPGARQRIAESSPGVPGKAERGDWFGVSLAIGEVCAGVPSVVVGAPYEAITDDGNDNGAVWAIPLSSTGTCETVRLWEGHILPGDTLTKRYIGEDVAVVRDAGADVDRIAIAGRSVLDIWSPATEETVVVENAWVGALAGR